MSSGTRSFLSLIGLSAMLMGMAASASLSEGANRSLAPEGMFYVYLPALLKQGAPAPIANPSFEDNTIIDLTQSSPCQYTGITDPTGNQHPNGWTFYSPAQGEAMPFPTKMQQGQEVPAISGGPGEYVHKCWWQLPENERLGGVRGLILHGDWTYKAFGSIPQALRLSQILTGIPGQYLQVTAYILGETHDTGPLEIDHFVASVKLGPVEDKRFYIVMKDNHHVTGNERAWNKFVVTAQIPPSGNLLLEVVMQQNWLGQTDFFIDNFSAESLLSP